MTMSAVGAPPLGPPVAGVEAMPPATGTGASAGTFALLVAAVLAANRQVPTTPPAGGPKSTDVAAQTTTGDGPVREDASSADPDLVPTPPDALPAGIVPMVSGGLTVPLAVAADSVATTAAPLVAAVVAAINPDPVHRAAGPAGADRGIPAGSSLPGTPATAADLSMPTVAAASAAPAAPTHGAAVPTGAGSGDGLPTTAQASPGDARQQTSSDGRGSREAPAQTLPAAVLPGQPSASVSSALSAALREAVALKTSEPDAAPNVTAAAATGQGVVGPAQTTVTSPGAQTTPLPGSPAATAAQLAPAVFAVHQRGVDGTHVMTVDINPVELGPVRLTVALREGQLHVLLAGSSELSREALRAALPELRKLVEATGITAGAFDVHPDQPDTGRPSAGTGGFFRDNAGGGHDGSPRQLPPDHSRPADPPTKPLRRVDVGSGTRSLDLHL
jgi:flagellar hook-length control protein FliK